MWILVAFAAGLGAFGAFMPGTTGLALIAIGCLLGIFARMAQASAHHREAMGETQEQA